MIQNQEEKRNPNGSNGQNETQEGMEEIIEEMATFICDDLCRFRDALNQERLEKHCSKCDLKDYISKLQAEYGRANDFEKSQLGKIMKKYRKITTCEECSYRFPDQDRQGNDTSWCKNLDGLGGNISKCDGCSKGKRKL